jgi:ABC-type sugar transport system substrate-binding protein
MREDDAAMARRVTLFLMSAENDYQAHMERTAREAAARCGMQLEVTCSGEGAVENPVRHIAQIFAALRQVPDRLPDAILIQPTSTHCASVLEAAARARVPCAVLNRRPEFLPDLRLRFPDVPLFSVGPDQAAIGRVQAEQVRALLPRGGRVLYVQGIEVASAVHQRRDAMMASLPASVEVVPVYGDWDDAQAERVVASWFARLAPGDRLPELCACQNDTMAAGAARVLARLAASRDHAQAARIPLTGCDHVERGQRLLEEGTLTATIDRGSSSVTAIEALAAFFRGQAMPQALLSLPVRSVPPIEALEELGRRRAR